MMAMLTSVGFSKLLRKHVKCIILLITIKMLSFINVRNHLKVYISCNACSIRVLRLTVKVEICCGSWFVVFTVTPSKLTPSRKLVLM